MAGTDKVYSQVVINEILADNETDTVDEDGDYSDWIEIFNAGPIPVDITGWFLTDDEDNRTKWPFPSTSISSGGYLLLFASSKDRRQSGSELHTNFSLTNGGEYLGLYDNNETLQFEYAPDFGLQYDDVSFGLANASATLLGVYFPSPTPGSLNGAGDATFKAQEPIFGVERGFFSSAFNLNLISPDGINIRYTTDGSDPTSTNGMVYTGPFLIDETSVIRAIASGGGFENSESVTSSYIFISDVLTQSAVQPGWPTDSVNAQVFDYEMDPDIVNDPVWTQQIIDSFQDISTVSIVTDMYNLVDPDSGIYVNAYERWERPASMELIEPDGSDHVQINAGLRIRGGFSRRWTNPKHSWRLLFKREYGDEKLRYNMFPDDDDAVQEFDNIDFRTAQNYSWSFRGSEKNTFLRDVSGRDSQRALGQPSTRSRYHHLFVNGLYFGLFMSEERPEASFGESYLGGNKEDYDVVKSSGASGNYETEATDGELDGDWKVLWDLSQLQFANPTLARYMQMQGLNPDGTPNPNYPVLLDRDNLIDEMLVTFFNATFDGPLSWFLNRTDTRIGTNNWSGMRNRVTDDKGFVFIQHDGEHSFGSRQEEYGQINRVGPSGLAHQNNFIASNPQYLHQDLVPTSDYRIAFSDRTYQVLYNGGELTRAKVEARIFARKEKIERAIVAESARWGDSIQEIPFTKNDWETAVLDQISWLDNRADSLIFQLRTAGIYPSNNPPHFSNTGTTYDRFEGEVAAGFQVTIDNDPNNNAGGIRYTIDGSDPRAMGGADQGIAGGDNVTVTVSGTMTINARVLNNGEWSALQTATFYAPQMLDKLVINEIHYNPLDQGTIGLPGYVDGDEFEFIELKNTSDFTLNLEGVQFVGGIEYVFPAGIDIVSGGFVVLAENAVEFENRYGFAPDGQYSDKLSNSGEQLILRDYLDVVLDSLSYGDSGEWIADPDGDGPSLSLDPAAGLNNDDPSTWYASAGNDGTPRTENNPNFPPDLAISFPADGQRFNPGFAFSIQVTATDQNDSVDSVRVQTGGLTFGFDDASPFSFGWTPPPGEYDIMAKGWDTFGREGDSEFVRIFIATSGACLAQDAIVINEINYNDDDDNGPISGDWIELYNPSQTAVDVSGWTFKDAKNENWIVLPNGTTIPANGYHVIVQDDVLFSAVHGINNKTGSFEWGLDGSGDHLRLYSSTGCLIDEVLYDDEAPWPLEADGQGSTLELVNANSDNNQAGEWQVSGTTGGSPGAVNSGLEISVDLLTPANNTGIGSGSPVIVTARVLSGTTVTVVDVYLDGMVVGQMTADPSDNGLYSYVLTELEDGVYTIVLKATNAASQFATSNGTLVCIGVIGAGPLVETGGQVVFEAEGFSNKIDRATDTWEEGNSNSGYVGAYMVTVPDDGTKVTTNYATTVSELQYLINFETTGTYYLWYRGWADSGNNNSVHFGLDGAETVTLNDVGLGSLNYGSWHWTSVINDGTRARLEVSASGIHNISLWLREDGTNVDRIILTTDPNFTPRGNGPEESARETSKVRLRAKVYLSGAFDAAMGKMRTDLNTGGYLPNSQPYVGLADKTVPADFFSNNPRIVDWVWLELRTGIEASTLVHKEAFLIRDDGWLINPSGSIELGINGVAEGSYYVVIGHRNHLSAMTATARALERVDFITANLSSNAALSYTSGPEAVRTLAANRIGLWQGDVTGDGVVKFTSASNDRVEVLNLAGGPTAFDFATGYHLEDVNMDGTVKYAGSNNDRVEILSTSGGPTAFDTRRTEVPN